MSELRRLTPWLRLDTGVLTDAKLRRARARGIWPMILLIMKQGGGVIAAEDLDAELIAQDLDGLLDAGGVAERLEALQREGLLVRGTYEVRVGRGVREVEGWTTPNWSSYQPDERSRRGGGVGPQPVAPRRPPSPRLPAVRDHDLQPPAPPAPSRKPALAFDDFLTKPEDFGNEWVQLGAPVREAVLKVWRRLPDLQATDGIARIYTEFGEATTIEALRRMLEDGWSNPRPTDVRRKCEEIKRTNSRPAAGPAAGRYQGRNQMPMRPAGRPS